MPQHETKSLQELYHTCVSAGGQTSGQDRISCVERDADCHGLAMVDSIARQLLELVRRPMTKIERPRRAHFEGITAEPNLTHVELGTSVDEMVQVRPGKACELVGVGLQPVKKLAVANQGNLH